MNRKVILTILDGRGLADAGQEHKSAIHLAKTPNFDKYRKQYPHSTLKTFWEHVGLPDGQMGNSEVGHMSIWSGRVIYQDLVKITKMMREWSFENIQVLQDIIKQAKETNEPVHIVGLLSDGWVHSHIWHILWLIDILDKNWIQSLVHAITDGRDVDPKSGIKYISELLEYIKGKNAKLVDVIGRYYAMDRDNRRERVKLATDLYTRWIGRVTNDIIAEMQKNYDKWVTDEFIKPIIYTPDFVQNDWNFDIIETERLTIKPVTIDDVDDIYNGASEEISEYFNMNLKTTRENTEKFVKDSIEKMKGKTDMIYIVKNKEDNKFVWTFWLHALETKRVTIWLRITKEQHGLWYWYEFCNAIKNRVFENLNEETYIRYEVYAENTWSVKLIEKLWWVLKSTQKENNWKNNDLTLRTYYIYNPNKSENTSDINIKNWSIAIMTNFRTDRGRELVDALTQYNHPENDIYKIDGLTVVTMTNYDDKFVGTKVLLPRDNITETLGELISKANKQQIRIAETEKYPHVTFFFSGGQESEFPGEKRILVNSPKVATYDMQPEMSAPEITAKILPELKANWPDFVALNFANTDMVGHTGDLSAAIHAAETVDACLWQIVDTALAHDYDIIVIADHGNADTMFNDDKSPNTAHTVNLVPCIYISKDLSATPFGILKDGKLADIAPTILHLMWIDKPESMDWVSLL